MTGKGWTKFFGRNSICIYFTSYFLFCKKLQCHALVHSNITYAILVWGHSTHLRKVFNQQRRCIRVLGGLGYRDDCRDIFKTFKILTVPCIYILQCALYMYKNKDNYCTLNHSHLTRHHNLLLSIHSRLHKTQNSTRYYCVKFYNALPLYLKNMDFNPSNYI
jgi:hypothetical protein